MSEFSRRDMLGAAAAGGVAAAATGTETFGQGQPPFGPTPAPLAGTELPSFRFQLGAVAPKRWDGGWAKEATVAEFPVSQALAGVLMSLVPGGLRELHWHANAAEWAYISKGPVPPPLPANPAPGSLDKGPLTHRYQLLAQRPSVYPGGTNRLVSQQQFPISATVTGALMQIKPGALREPHWHPNADEWQYYISGRARMTVFGSHGRVRTDEFNAGDVGYVPQGYGHYIENIGNEDVELLIALNNGSYESISLADWIGANPHLLLATNFEVPENTFKDFQTRNRFLVGW